MDLLPVTRYVIDVSLSILGTSITHASTQLPKILVQLDRDEFPQMGSWRFPNSDSIPTSLCLPGLYASTLLVGSSTGHLMQFDFATEKPVRVLG
jgi:hypothetical protein